MFTQEKDMIPVLKDELSVMFVTDFFIEEFRSGNGVVDLAFTTDCNEKRASLKDFDFESIYFLTRFLNRKNKKLTLEKLFLESSLRKKKIVLLLDYILEYGYLEEKDNHFVVQETYKAVLADLISIEAKIKDWKHGFYQAMRYKYFSNMSFLAISYEYAHRVDLSLLKKNNIGLISVSKNCIEIIFKPQKKKPLNKICFNYLTECFISLISDSY